MIKQEITKEEIQLAAEWNPEIVLSCEKIDEIIKHLDKESNNVEELSEYIYIMKQNSYNLIFEIFRLQNELSKISEN